VQTLQTVGFASRRRTGGLRPRRGRLGLALAAERGWAGQGQAGPWRKPAGPVDAHRQGALWASRFAGWRLRRKVHLPMPHIAGCMGAG